MIDVFAAQAKKVCTIKPKRLYQRTVRGEKALPRSFSRNEILTVHFLNKKRADCALTRKNISDNTLSKKNEC